MPIRRSPRRRRSRHGAYLRIGANIYPDWNHLGFGDINIDYGFGHSSDTFFYQLAGMLGADRLGYWAQQYGFGAPTGVDLPGEAAGIVPTNAVEAGASSASTIFPGEVYQAGIGQGYDVVTPIQLINAYAALANGGKLYQPQIVQQVVGPDGQVVQPFKPELIRKPWPPAPRCCRTMRVAARCTRQLLRHTYNLVDDADRHRRQVRDGRVRRPGRQGRLPYSSWFVGFVPKDAAKTASDPDGSRRSHGPTRNLVVMAFAYDSRTVGNAATEIVKYFLQMHYDIKKDLRAAAAPRDRQLLRATDDGSAARRAGTGRRRGPRGRSAPSGASSTCSCRCTPGCWSSSAW